MKKLALLLLVMTSVAAQEAPVDYRFDEVKRKVLVTSAKQERRVDKGEHAQGGDKVQTGWFSYALIASERYRAKFEIFSSTDVQLAEGTPGVILSVERGTLHAIFDKITGTEPFLVHAGQESTFSRREMPRAREMPKDRGPDGRTRRESPQHDGQHPQQPGESHGGRPPQPHSGGGTPPPKP